MGGSMQSRMEENVAHAKTAAKRFAATQREVQMAVNIARTRDQIQWGTAVYSGILFGAIASKVQTGTVPTLMRPPLVIIPIVLLYFSDMAYGTKLQRVVKEAEHILENERFRFVPPKQIPFYDVYDEEREELEKSSKTEVGRVGEYWPSLIRSLVEPDGPRTQQQPPKREEEE